MKASFSIKQKAKLVLLLFAILLAELYSGFSQKSNCSQLSDVVHEVYSDRLVVQDYIYKMNERIHEQKYCLFNRESLVSVRDSLEKSNTEIFKILKQYELTRLTSQEEKVLSDLKITITELQAILGHSKKNVINLERAIALYKKDIEVTFDHLSKLSEIQISRGKDLDTDSIRITSYAGLIDQFNSAILIIIGLVIIGITFTSESIIPKFPRQENLN